MQLITKELNINRKTANSWELQKLYVKFSQVPVKDIHCKNVPSSVANRFSRNLFVNRHNELLGSMSNSVASSFSGTSLIRNTTHWNVVEMKPFLLKLNRREWKDAHKDSNRDKNESVVWMIWLYSFTLCEKRSRKARFKHGEYCMIADIVRTDGITKVEKYKTTFIYYAMLSGKRLTMYDNNPNILPMQCNAILS